jgi:hypothetical protein
MATKIDFIRKTLFRLGWRPEEKEIGTLAGTTLWVVFCKHEGRSFSVQGDTQNDAWESALGLVGQFRKNKSEPRMILPFPSELPSYHKAV